MKSFPLILSIVVMALTFTRCDDNDDDDNFRYWQDNIAPYVCTTFHISGATVDDAFMAQTSGYCHENRRDMTIKAGSSTSIVVQFPSTNSYSDFKSVRTDTSTVYTKTYLCDLTLNGQSLKVKAYFSMEILDRLKNYYMDSQYYLTQIEIDGRKADADTSVSIIEPSFAISLQDGKWELAK